jgi:hypothetical protein
VSAPIALGPCATPGPETVNRSAKISLDLAGVTINAALDGLAEEGAGPPAVP